MGIRPASIPVTTDDLGEDMWNTQGVTRYQGGPVPIDIYVNPESPPANMVATLAHEMTHVALENPRRWYGFDANEEAHGGEFAEIVAKLDLCGDPRSTHACPKFAEWVDSVVIPEYKKALKQRRVT
jgi:hypothetical protein